jgi:hypothetical protein
MDEHTINEQMQARLIELMGVWCYTQTRQRLLECDMLDDFLAHAIMLEACWDTQLTGEASTIIIHNTPTRTHAEVLSGSLVSDLLDDQL